MKKLIRLVYRMLFDLSLRNNPFAWIGIFLMKELKCAPTARWLQYMKGGKILYSIKEDWSDGKVSDHFMNVFGREVVDYYGNRAIMVDNQTIDFGDGKYRIVAIEDEWRKFGINGLKDLLEKDRLIHSTF